MNPDPISEIRALGIGVRAVVVSFILICASVDIRLSLQIDRYRLLFEDALPGEALPYLTNLLIHGQTIWIIISIALPILGLLLAVVIRNNKTALISLSGLMILISFQAWITATGLFSPMLGLFGGMSDAK